MKLVFVVAFILSCVCAIPCGGSPPPIHSKINGVIYAGWSTGGMSSAMGNQSMQLMASALNNSGWASVVVTYYQPNINSTSVGFLNGSSPSDTDIRSAIQNAQRNGLNVALKPHVDLSDDTAHWRGEIGTYFDDQDWADWFQSYIVYLNHMATIAQEEGVNLLIVGTELSVTQPQESYWREVISSVRSIYSGPLVYGANWDTINLTWWDAVDYIGVDAYFPLTIESAPSVDVLVAGWQPYLIILSKLSEDNQRKIIFTEIGYQSVSDAAITPWQASGYLDLQTQYNCYQAVYAAPFAQSWLQGIFYWAWVDVVPNGGPQDESFTPEGKPAQNLLSQY